MAVKIRLARRGRKKLALYDIVIADERSPRDGRFIEKIGNYNPNTHPAQVTIKEDAAIKWLSNGAQPTNTVRNILSKEGILLKKHLQVGVHKSAITQEEADKKWLFWKQEKQNKLAKNPVLNTIAKPNPIKSAPKKGTQEEKSTHNANSVIQNPVLPAETATIPVDTPEIAKE